MATTLTRQAPTATPSATPEAPTPTNARITVMAGALWGVVGSLLTYGIVMTVIKASALFA